jgi:transcriptional regulator with XRE-family HTH domain
MNIDRFREIREKRGLSKRQLAKLSGFQEMQILRYESGENDPSTENLKRLAQILKVSTDYLLGISDDPQGHYGDDSLSEIEQRMISTYRRGGWVGVIELSAKHVTDKLE